MQNVSSYRGAADCNNKPINLLAILRETTSIKSVNNVLKITSSLAFKPTHFYIQIMYISVVIV